MGIVKTGIYGFENIKSRFSKEAASADKYVLRMLTDLGIEMCNHARTITPNHESGGYEDQTANLRSSIGFRIYHNGERVQDGGFQSMGGPDGVKQAKNALDKYATSHDISVNGWVLVIVAGMSYATYVEAKGYNVLHLTEVELKKQIRKLKKQLLK